MAYIPQSKIKISQTGGNEFIDAITKEPYIGSYLELSDGRCYKGSNTVKFGDLLIRPLKIPSNFNSTNDNKLYTELKRNQFNTLTKRTLIPSSRPVPVEKDYIKGYFKRYFCKRVNEDLSYIEINFNTFNDIVSRNEKYDYNLHIVGMIKWALMPPPDGTLQETNAANLSTLTSKFPNIGIIFPQLDEYGPLLATDKNPMWDMKGRKYKGMFHVHPNLGAMKGPYHTDKPHAKLLNFNPAKNQLKSEVGGVRSGIDRSGGGRTLSGESSGRTPGRTSGRSIAAPSSSPPSTSGGGRGGY